MVVPPSGGGQSSAGGTVRASPASGANSTVRSKNGSVFTNGNWTIPLSARKAAPLDMSSVERKGQPLISRETPKRIRPHGLTEAPTFRPTEEEFKDPLKYMQKITPEGRKYGIVKVIPPENWNPEFAIDTERFHFRTRRQELNSVEGDPDTPGLGTRANLNYLDLLAKFHRQLGTNLNRFPSVDKRPLDLYRLKKAVEVRGGFDKVCKQKKWAEIGRDLGYSGKIMSSLSTSLKNSYQRWLHPYEEYLRVAKPGVQQQLEFEYGGPLTPSPASSPMKKSHQNTPSSLRGESPAVRASAALNASLKEAGDTEKSASMLEAPRPISSSGFTAVNSGGFTPVNASPAFTPVNMSNGAKRESENGVAPNRRSVASPMGSSKNTPEYRHSGLSSTPITNGNGPNPLKRQLSHESSRKENGVSNADSETGERRSKRLKNGSAVPTVAGSHMTLFRPSTPRIPGERGTEKPGEKCESCLVTDDPSSLLLCDSCDNGYHTYCLDPPVKVVPERDWNCPRCLVGTGEFGFEDGNIYSLKQFQEKAHNFKESYFLPKMPFDPVLNCKRPVTEDDVEREFWRLVESITETVEVEYGADIHSTTHGSGFPTIEKNPLNIYSTDPWNLNILPLHSESLFRHIKSDVSGMTVPWLYVGMCFSTFCWHNEDHYTYSANYQHFGSTKTWYGIPGEDAEKFEDAMRKAVPELFEQQPDLLFQLVTLLPPDQLKKAGVRVYALDQRAGQFVVTFPQAYHAGFNHGFNFNEAVNFAPNDWEPYGEAGVERLQAFRRQPCFSHDEMLLTAASRDSTIRTAKWLAPALERIRDRELGQRMAFVNYYKEIADRLCPQDGGDKAASSDNDQPDIPWLVPEKDDHDVPEEEYICCYCKAFTYLTRIKCNETSKVLCLSHHHTYDCCRPADTEDQHKLQLLQNSHTYRARYTDQALSSLVQKIVDRAHVPEVWAEKVERALEDTARPSLKLLRSLLSEGDRIPYELPQFSSLKAFVDRCNDWVDEATNYITRKQQNRRKNEKAWRKGNSAKAAELEERDRELRKIENIVKLLAEADEISFDCPEIDQLRQRADAIADFQNNARGALSTPGMLTTQEFEELMEMGKSYNVDIPELEQLDKFVHQLKWIDRARECRGTFLTLKDVGDLIQQGLDLGIADANEHLTYFQEQKQAGDLWEAKAKELMSVDAVHYQQLEALSGQASTLPVSRETLAQVDQILNKQREAHRQIVSLYERSKELDFRKRPKYKDVREVMDALTELQSKPTGTIDLEKEQKRHEDWMRKGKKLFGKANAPLHILLMHMTYVEQRNIACFDLKDRPRTPVEPASREPTPDHSRSGSELDSSRRAREVFCICRQPEAGMMIECELCHEWYHGKCLKIARGKVKEDDKYTCPICDWRVKIPRDAARPKLEDLQDWQSEIQGLPFQPEEEECLASIVNTAQEFRDFMRPYVNPLITSPEEVPTQRFYLRKIEGAEILLAYETNFFRQELHKWVPVAPHAPPVLEHSLSTRKPRPTKQQKLMAQLGIENPDDLPQNLRTKPHNFAKRKSSEPHSKQAPPTLQPAPHRSVTPSSQSQVHSNSTPAPTANPTTLTQSPGQPSAPYEYGNHFRMGSPSQGSPSFAPSSAFLHGHPAPSLGSPTFDPPSPTVAGLESALFDGPNFGRDDPATTTIGSPVANHFGSGQGSNIDTMFADLTNQDVDGLGSSHANDALAVSGNDSEEPSDANLAEQFLNN